jgi:hypothetical protein
MLRMSEDDDPVPILELKQRVVLYLPSAPGPATARKLYDCYVESFGSSIDVYRSTVPGDIPERWTEAARLDFETRQLPQIRERLVWGYIFGMARPVGARSFLFHGFRPSTESGCASIARFDFEWDFDPAQLRAFMVRVLGQVECVSATAGYVLNPDDGDHGAQAYRLMFAWAMRYVGAQAQHLEADVVGALQAIPCIGWLTFIGPDLLARQPGAVQAARAVAHASAEIGGGVLIQVEPALRTIDRNRREPLGNYAAVARALLPLQAVAYEAFDDDLWDEQRVALYQHRFTELQELER